MRTIIDIPAQDLEIIQSICENQKISRAEVIRRAISLFLQKHFKTQADEAFGIWKGKDIDSLDYVDKIRKEWDR